MTEQLNNILTWLSRLSYEELAAFVYAMDLQQIRALKGSAKEAERIKGEGLAKHLRAQRKGQPYEDLERRLAAIRDLDQAAQQLSADEQQTAGHVARTLLAALQPVERRRKRRDQSGRAIEEVARGRVEAKYIKVPVYDLITGVRATDEAGQPLSRGPGGVGPAKEIPGYGPYLYVRIWATGGGKDRQLKRFKSKYVGLKGTAIHFESLEPSSDERRALAEEILERYEGRTLRSWAQERWPDPEPEEGEPVAE
jgi:hypothetical protein